MPELIPPEWPAVWQSLYRSQLTANSERRVRGARTTISKDGVLTYWCTCGSTFTRREGELVPEAQLWVTEHKEHLPPEEQIDVPPT